MLKIISTIDKNDVQNKLEEMKNRYFEKYFLDRYIVKEKENDTLVILEMIFKPIRNKIILHD